MIEYCQTVYYDNPFQLILIGEFECNYAANKAIWWYPRDSFPNKLITKRFALNKLTHCTTCTHSFVIYISN
jgi:hypothetical protein